ncbi:hypothetical protein N9N67_01860 [Bacteriovoracaceae bacterium]|nr:hypothetical protein [Bacteriovoracaceae bacterium]
MKKIYLLFILILISFSAQAELPNVKDIKFTNVQKQTLKAACELLSETLGITSEYVMGEAFSKQIFNHLDSTLYSKVQAASHTRKVLGVFKKIDFKFFAVYAGEDRTGEWMKGRITMSANNCKRYKSKKK